MEEKVGSPVFGLDFNITIAIVPCTPCVPDKQDPYYAGLDDVAANQLENTAVPAADLMIFDCERRITVIVSFYGHAYLDMAQMLRTFITQHPEFVLLIQPILDHDPESASGGEFSFKRVGNKVKYCLTLNPMVRGQKKKAIEGELTFELFRQFITLTEPFGCFMTDDGSRPLTL